MTNNIKTKNVFIKNRLKDIHKEIAKYVYTNDNPADWITRSESLDKFKAQLLFWLQGPFWLVGEALQWPASELGCLIADSRMLVLNHAVVISPVDFANSAMVELERFLSLAKLLRVVTYVFRFVISLKKVFSDPT